MLAAKDIYFRNTFYAVPYISSFTPLTVNGLDDALLTLPVCCNLSFQLPIGFSSQVACKKRKRENWQSGHEKLHVRSEKV